VRNAVGHAVQCSLLRRKPIAEEGGIFHIPAIVVDVLLVELAGTAARLYRLDGIV
jgi:hypothetical protein